jgi:bacterioferritin (cytochrome b1)
MLLRFAQVEAGGGRDLVRAAETTDDATLRELFLRHAADEQHHATLFRERGLDILRSRGRGRSGASAEWIAPGERGLDDLRVEREPTGALLAFLHLSEKAAARDFSRYIRVLGADPSTRAVFQKVVRDESFHMSYTRDQLLRVAPQGHGRLLWQARLRRLWKLYLRLAGGLAAMMGAVILTVQYFVLLPPFAWAARRAARAEAPGWTVISPGRSGRLDRQY